MPRTTRVLAVDRDNPDRALLDEAATVLRAGGLVAFATETVYGLGADATDAKAVARIFEAKGRPSFNPLIVHAEGIAMARGCVSAWPATAALLAERFWPGPLTLVLPRSPAIPEVVTAGLPTVGIRVPRPAVARELIARTGRPLAAPSANRSNGVSPTRADHVLDDLAGRIDLVLDSGPTEVGLESTVLDLAGGIPRILRPGPVALADLSHALGGMVADNPQHAASDAPTSPGQLALHYSPNTPALRVDDPATLADFPAPETAALLICGRHTIADAARFLHTFTFDDPESASRNLYTTLRAIDRLGVERIAIVAPADDPTWRTIRDRLWRASRPLEP